MVLHLHFHQSHLIAFVQVLEDKGLLSLCKVVQLFDILDSLHKLIISIPRPGIVADKVQV